MMIPPSPGRLAIRAQLLGYDGNPFVSDPADCVRHESDGLILVADGRISHVGPYAADLVPPGVELHEYRDALLMPGFIDAHVHYAQTPMIGAYGKQLLDWLETYVFPVEQRYADPDFARAMARLFFAQELAAGVTTTLSYCTVHPGSVDAYFEEAARLGLRAGAGKVLMDRNAPEPLRDTAQRGYDDSRRLIDRWHGRGRLFYAVTPRFAPTSTPAQLEAAGALFAETDGVCMQTHLSENLAELDWVRALFPDALDYLDVYDRAGLVGPRSLFGHAIHLSPREWDRLAGAGAAVVHCPTSNLFLGSGLFDLRRALIAGNPVRTALGSDIGAGTSFSPLATLNEAYKVAALRGEALSAHRAFYLATLGSARALYMDDRIGRLAPGYEADFAVLDLAATPLLRERLRFADTLEEALFVLMTLGGAGCVRATYAAGRLVHDRTRPDASAQAGEGCCDTVAVGRIGAAAIGDVPLLDVPRGIAERAGGVVE
ncbi:guanine deaminase [Acidiphilium multivorum]|nr:guanine deaminase [Acidiphilium multivorum]UNC12824.1 guanine deaminase [Acidiphilium multivorum]